LFEVLGDGLEFRTMENMVGSNESKSIRAQWAIWREIQNEAGERGREAVISEAETAY